MAERFFDRRSSLLSDSSSSGDTVRQLKVGSSSPAGIESPVLKVSPAELSRLSNVLVQSVDVTRYYDSYEFDNASLTEGKYYFGGGYVSFHSGGAVEYSAIVSDYRGSTRVVLSAAGGSLQQSVQQLNGYYPSGAIVADYQTSHLGGTSSADVQTRKFTGKELDRMHGLDWHDFGARRYDASAVFFTSPDPLSEKYYHINPYVYCAGNPVRYVDPDGREIRYSMTEEQKNALDIDNFKESSALFNTVYSSVKQSENVYNVKFGETPNKADGVFNPNESTGGGTIVFSIQTFNKLTGGETMPSYEVAEEFFHAYQNDNINSYDTGSFNFEFEAKCFTTMACVEYGYYFDLGSNKTVHKFQNDLRTGCNYGGDGQFITPENVGSSRFLEDYKDAANLFAEDYANQGLGNIHYWVSTEVAPASLQKLIKEAYHR